MVKDLTQVLQDAAKYQAKLGAGLILRPVVFNSEWIKSVSGRRMRAIRWKIRPKPPNWVFVKPPFDLVRRFADLRTASDQQILLFARKWGILGICGEHPWYPVHHKDPISSCWPIGEPDPEKEGAYTSSLAEGLEPIRFWRRYSWLFHAVLEIGRALSQGKVGKRRCWSLLFPELRHNKVLFRAASPSDLVDARFRFVCEVEKLYELSGVRNMLDWNPENTRGKGQWVWRHRTTRVFNLIGVLAIQAAGALGTGGHTAVCSGCTREYSGGNRPKKGKANYCPSCRRDKQDLRAADERRRVRRRTETEMLADGKAIEDIARETGSRLSTVKNLATKLNVKVKTNGKA